MDLVGDACKPTAQDLRLMRRMVFASTEGTEVMRTLLAPCLAVDAPQPMLRVTRSVCGRRARGSDKARGVDVSNEKNEKREARPFRIPVLRK